MANLRVGETGKRLRFATSFDMSSNTSLTFDFTKGDNSTLSVTAILGTTAETFNIGGVSTSVLANEWVYYDFDTGDLSANSDGTWTVEFTYTNTTPTPDDSFKAKATFTVDP